MLTTCRELQDHRGRENGENRWDGGDQVTQPRAQLLFYMDACTQAARARPVSVLVCSTIADDQESRW